MSEEFSSIYWENDSPSNPPPATLTHDVPDTTTSNGFFEAMPLNEPSSSSSSGLKAIQDTSFIHSSVTNPQKEQEGSQNAYISYLITTESNNPTFESTTFHVRRRFSDFHFLYTILYLEHPTTAVPPLPDKARLEYIKGDRFGLEFTLKRAGSLNRFLDRISNHPILRNSTTYHNFLETHDWNAFKKSLNIRYQQVLQDNGSVLEGLSDSLLNAFAKVNKPDDELLEIKERIDKLDDNLLQVEKSFSKVLRRQADISNDLEEFSQYFIKLSGLESNIEGVLTSFAGGTHNMSQKLFCLKETTDIDYVVSLRDMQNYVAALRALVKLREQKQLDLEALGDYLAKAKYEKDSLLSGNGATNFLRAKIEDVRGVNHELARKERLANLETKIQSLQDEVRNVEQSNASFQEILLNEVQIFEQNKQIEMKKTLSTLADANIAFYQSIIDEWKF